MSNGFHKNKALVNASLCWGLNQSMGKSDLGFCKAIPKSWKSEYGQIRPGILQSITNKLISPVKMNASTNFGVRFSNTVYPEM